MQIRGAGIRSLFLAIEKLHGAEKLRAVKAAVPARLREQVEPVVLPVQWYPIEVVAAFQVAVRDVIGAGSWDVSHALGVEAAKVDFGGIYRVLVRAVPYETIWDKIPRAWQQYNSQGTAQWTDRREGFASGVARGVVGYNMGLWQSVAGRTEGLLVMAGVRAASVSVVDSSSTYAKFEALWMT
jgi:hypothetical protein